MQILLRAVRPPHDARHVRGERGPVLLCFTSDPYQPCEEEHRLTREAICILSYAGLEVRVLTKNPTLAITSDLDVLRAANVEFGVSLAWTSDEDRVKWEPHAGTVAERMDALAIAHENGLRTWVSIEPVIDPAQALDVLLLDTVDVFKIGKLNHDKVREAQIDWRAFLVDVLTRLEGRSCGYYIKNDIWAWADDEIKSKWPRSSSVTHRPATKRSQPVDSPVSEG